MTKTYSKILEVLIATLMATETSIFAGQSAHKEITPKTGPQAPTESIGPVARVVQGGEMEGPRFQVRNPRYKLRKGDSVELDFPLTPTFNQIVTVQPDGYITLHRLGDLWVEGKTLPELTETLRAEYAKILRDPVVTVELKDFEKPYFIAGGEVGHPGKYELRGDTTVAQAVAIAGGFAEHAKHSQVLLFRRVSDDWVEVKQVNMKKMLQQANLREDMHLNPGDMLFVPQTALGKLGKAFFPRLSLGPYIRPY